MWLSYDADDLGVRCKCLQAHRWHVLSSMDKFVESQTKSLLTGETLVHICGMAAIARRLSRDTDKDQHHLPVTFVLSTLTFPPPPGWDGRVDSSLTTVLELPGHGPAHCFRC